VTNRVTVTETRHAVTVTSAGSITVTDAGQVSVLEVGAMGPQGPSGVLTATATAHGAVSGNHVVAYRSDGTVEHASAATPAHQWASVGITVGAAADGAEVTVQSFGKMIEPGWSWTPLGLIYLSTAGNLTQTPPAYPSFLRVIGYAITATSMWIDIQSPIVLA